MRLANIKEDGVQLWAIFWRTFRRTLLVATPCFSLVLLWLFFTDESLASNPTWTYFVVSPILGFGGAAILGLCLAVLACIHHLAGLWVFVPLVVGVAIAAVLLVVFEPGSDPFHNTWAFSWWERSGGHGSPLDVLLFCGVLIEALLKWAFVAIGGFFSGAAISFPLLVFGTALRTHKRHAKRDAALPNDSADGRVRR